MSDTEKDLSISEGDEVLGPLLEEIVKSAGEFKLRMKE